MGVHACARGARCVKPPSKLASFDPLCCVSFPFFFVFRSEQRYLVPYVLPGRAGLALCAADHTHPGGIIYDRKKKHVPRYREDSDPAGSKPNALASACNKQNKCFWCPWLGAMVGAWPGRCYRKVNGERTKHAPSRMTAGINTINRP